MDYSKNSNTYEETHNNCTKEKCFFNPIEKNKSTTNDNEEEIRCLANFCVSCGINLGDCNPRQYCYKTYCLFENVDESTVIFKQIKNKK
jgi:hypothetical protein